MFSIPHPGAAWLAAATLAAVVPAQAATFSFTASGFGVSGTCAGSAPDCMDAFTIGDAQDTGGSLFPIAGSWSQSLNFNVVPSTGAVTGTWSLFDIDPSLNDLSGTISGTWSQGAGGATLTLAYVVTSGGGMFAGFAGGGQSVMQIDTDFNYTESGSFTVSAVPEPATYALWLAGAAGVVGAARRRRK